MNRTTKECTLIEQLIIKSQLEKLTSAETVRLNMHLEECPDCRSFQLNIANLLKSLTVNETDSPLPKPEIHLLLRQKVREIKSAKSKSDYSLKEIFINILKRPIPLYQVAVVVILIFCLAAYALYTFSKSEAESATLIKGHSPQASIYEQYINYYPTQSALPLKVGINAAEDTSFNSILFSAL